MAFDIESRSKRMHAVDREILLSFWKAHILHHAGQRPIHGHWIVTELRRRYGELVDSVAPSSEAKAAGAKVMSSEEYNAKSANPAYAQELSKFFSSGGTIGPDAADAQ